MNKLLIPSAPNWFETNVLACAPDDTVMYGSRGDIIIITPIGDDGICHTEVIFKAHSGRVTSIDVNRNWCHKYKHAVTVAEDKIVKTWDMEAYVQRSCHNKHVTDDSKVLGASYIGDNNIMSISENGKIIMWHTLTNNIDIMDFLNKKKSLINCFSLCPHNNTMVALGLKSGLILLVSLKGNGKIIYKLRGHDTCVSCFAWCPVPINILSEATQSSKIIKTHTTAASTQEEEVKAIAFKKTITEVTDDITKTDSTNVIEENKLGAEQTITPLDNENDIDRIYSEISQTENICENSTSNNLANESEPEQTPVVEHEIIENNDKSEIGIIPTDEIAAPLIREADLSTNGKIEQLEQEGTTDDKTSDANNEEFLLASVSVTNSKIIIWRCGTDGGIQTTLIKEKKQKRNFNKSYVKPWNILCWITPNILLYSSTDAELYMYNFKQAKSQHKLIHNDHRNHLFSIKSAAVYLKEYNNKENAITAWTIGRDRYILNVDIKSHYILRCYSTLGYNVTCFCGSVLDPNRLAFISGEGAIHIWDLSKPNKERIEILTHYQKVFYSITTLAWNPDNDMLLAWGTTEGTVGIFDASNNTNKLMVQYFKSPIYKIEWGPLPKLNNKGLYVVCDGKLAIFNPLQPHAKPNPLTIAQGAIYTIGWKPDFSLLLVVPKSDNLLTYTPDLQLMNLYYMPQRTLSIIWHPDATTSDITSSKYCQMFVTLSKSTEIVVYNLGIEGECISDKIIVNFKNRDSIINSMAWSPHCGSHFVFLDQDGVAQVFDIEQKIIISTYINPFCDPFHPVYWSPIDSDYIIGAIQGNKIIIWKVSENGPLTESEIVQRRTDRLESIAKAVNEKYIKPKDKTKPKQVNGNGSTVSSIVPIFYSSGKESQRTEDIKKLLNWKLNNNYTVENDRKNFPNVDIFEANAETDNIFALNMNTLKREGNYHATTLLSLFKGNLNETIKEAIEHKKLDPTIIALCPMVSPTLWKTACETYAEQLMEQPDANPFEIVTFLLTCHRVEEAINILCEKNLYKEALLLAKRRFGGNSNIFKNVLEKWSHVLIHFGNYEQASLCFIALGKYENAASALLKRTNQELIQIAVDLAKLSNNLEFYKAALLKLVSCKLIDDGKSNPLKNSENGVHEKLQVELDSVIDCKLQENGTVLVNEEKQNDKTDGNSNLTKNGGNGEGISGVEQELQMELNSLIDSKLQDTDNAGSIVPEIDEKQNNKTETEDASNVDKTCTEEICTKK